MQKKSALCFHLDCNAVRGAAVVQCTVLSIRIVQGAVVQSMAVLARARGRLAGQEGGRAAIIHILQGALLLGLCWACHHFLPFCTTRAARVQCTKQNGKAGNTRSPTPGAELEKEIVYLVAKHELEMCTLSLALEWTNQPNQWMTAR